MNTKDKLEFYKNEAERYRYLFGWRFNGADDLVRWLSIE